MTGCDKLSDKRNKWSCVVANCDFDIANKIRETVSDNNVCLVFFSFLFVNCVTPSLWFMNRNSESGDKSESLLFYPAQIIIAINNPRNRLSTITFHALSPGWSKTFFSSLSPFNMFFLIKSNHLINDIKLYLKNDFKKKYNFVKQIFLQN